MSAPIRVAVVTGGHSYDVPHFHELFRRFPDVDACVQGIDDFAASPKDVRQAYDAVLFYIMMMDGPTDEHLPWYAGKPLTALSELGETRQGIVVLHHALLAYPQWPVWNDLVGIGDRRFGYHIGEKLHVQVADSAHPITQGLADWDMIDETYTMTDAGADSRILLSTDHPRRMRHLAWTRQYRQARVFCFESGHDNATWPNPQFRTVLQRGMLWSAGRL